MAGASVALGLTDRGGLSDGQTMCAALALIVRREEVQVFCAECALGERL